MSRWRDARVVVTGGRGFLGRALCRTLSEHGVRQVVALGSADYDLTRAGEVERMFTDTEPELVVHLAAHVGGIGANMRAPAELYVTNLLMGTHVLEEARVRGTAKIVIVGTICSYPKYTPVPFSEDSLWDGYPEETNAPYGLAKKALLVQAQANRAQYGQNAIYLLPTNLYGPGDKFNPGVSHVIPALIKKCVEARESGAGSISVWGTGRATREFLYVDDAARGILAAAEQYELPDPVNLGSGQEIAIADLARLVARVVGFEGELRFDPTKPDGQPRRFVDSSRAARAFGWSATTALEDGLRRTIDWYLENRRAAESVAL